MVDYNKHIVSSVICGLILQILAVSGAATSNMGGLLLFGIFFPGFIYCGLLFNDAEKKRLNILLFFLLGGFINIATAIGAPWIVNISKAYILLFICYGLSCASFFLVYYWLINNKLHLQKGLLLAFAGGALSAIMPVISEICKRDLSAVWEIILFTSSIPVWQTLFAVALKLSAKPNTQNIIQSSSVTTA